MFQVSSETVFKIRSIVWLNRRVVTPVWLHWLSSLALLRWLVLFGNFRHWNSLLGLFQHFVQYSAVGHRILIDELSERNFLHPSVRYVLNAPTNKNNCGTSEDTTSPFTSPDWICSCHEEEPVHHYVLHTNCEANNKPEPEIELCKNFLEYVQLSWSNLSTVDVVEDLKEYKSHEDYCKEMKLHLAIPIFFA